MTVLVLAAAMVLGTGLFGWWSVPVLGLGYGAWRGEEPAAAFAALAALLSWGSLMAWNGLSGPVLALAGSLGEVMGLPGWSLILATLLFPAVLAGAAANLGAAVRGALSE